MHYAQYNRLTGVIAQVFDASPDDVELYRSSVVDVIPCGGDVRFDTHYVSPELELLELPARPAWWSVWDRDAMRWVDPRPLADQAADCWERIKSARDSACSAPIVHAGHTLDGDADSQARLLQACQLGQLMPPGWSVTWTLADNTAAVLTADDLVAIVRSAGARTNEAFQRGRVLRAAIDAATTAEQLAAISWTSDLITA